MKFLTTRGCEAIETESFHRFENAENIGGGARGRTRGRPGRRRAAAAYGALPVLLALLVVWSGAGSRAASTRTIDDVEEAVRKCWASLAEAGKMRDVTPVCVARAAASMAPRILGRRFRDLSDGEKRRFERALGTAFTRELFQRSRALGLDSDALPETTLSGGEGPSTTVLVRLPGASGAHRLRLSLQRPVSSSEQGFGVADVSWGGVSVVETYRELCEHWIDRYSVAFAIGELEGRGVVVLADFEDDTPFELPRGWKSRGWKDVSEEPYEVLAESGNQFLRAEDRGENVVLYRAVRWNSVTYPYLSWRWRIRSLPDGGDARVEEKADNAAAIYLSYRRKLGLLPVTVKFVWSERLPKGSAFRRPGIGMPWTVVAGRGEPDRARWHRVVVHISDVYQNTFGGDPGERPLGIGLLSDANNTGGLASADYDDIVVLKEASDVMQVRELIELDP